MIVVVMSLVTVTLDYGHGIAASISLAYNNWLPANDNTIILLTQKWLRLIHIATAFHHADEEYV
jgi:hypothetical protein